MEFVRAKRKLPPGSTPATVIPGDGRPKIPKFEEDSESEIESCDFKCHMCGVTNA